MARRVRAAPRGDGGAADGVRRPRRNAQARRARRHIGARHHHAASLARAPRAARRVRGARTARLKERAAARLERQQQRAKARSDGAELRKAQSKAEAERVAAAITDGVNKLDQALRRRGESRLARALELCKRCAFTPDEYKLLGTRAGKTFAKRAVSRRQAKLEMSNPELAARRAQEKAIKAALALRERRAARHPSREELAALARRERS